MQNHIFISLPIPGIYLFPLRFLKVILISNVYTLYVNYILCFHSDMNAQEKVKIWKNVIRFFFLSMLQLQNSSKTIAHLNFSFYD